MPLIDATTNRSSRTAKKAGAVANDPRPGARKVRLVKDLRSFYALLSNHRWHVGSIVVLAVLTASFALIRPYLFRYAMDGIVLADHIPTGQKSEKLVMLGGLILLLVVAEFIGAYWTGVRGFVLENKLTGHLRRRVLSHMVRLPISRIREMKAGGAASRLEDDTYMVGQMIDRTITTPVSGIFRISVSLIMIFVINWSISLAALVAIVPMVLATQAMARPLRALYRDLHQRKSRLSAFAAEIFSGVRVLRLYRREQSAGRSYIRHFHEIVRGGLAARRRELWLNSSWQFIFDVIQLLIIIASGVLIIKSKATIGDVFAIVTFIALMVPSIAQTIRAYTQVQENLAAFDRVTEILDTEKDKPDLPGALPAPVDLDVISIHQVDFRYAPEADLVLANIAFTIRRGQTVAIVGKSGAGKSTLIDLISRFQDPTRGCIRLNGIDLRNIALQSYRGLFGLVEQDVFLFDGSIAENIAYANRGSSRFDIEMAARSANAHEFIEKLPEGYETIIGERGFRLSGGQRQRVSIARAFLADPRVLIMDEATSNLDSESESQIQQAIQKLLQNRTTIIIAHRLSTIAHADQIIVLEGGRIAESGTHPELIALGGMYCAMIERQRTQTVGSAEPLAFGAKS